MEESGADSTQNRLASQKSPYLLQHKNNPVNWYPWGEEAFLLARSEDKPIFLSIGYSTCYWCHVMEQDSFETSEIGAALNKNFVSIKVDREERPDIDQIYMDAVMGMTGHGGWPMSVFLTPDLKPFFGGTFFRRDQFLQLMQKISETWQSDRDRLLESASKIAELLQERDLSSSEKLPDDDAIVQAFVEMESNFDYHWAGFGEPPKFPPSQQISLLLRVYQRSHNERALNLANLTLDKMARGGIYDHLGGGFHRYSVDKKWRVPHFEKMLYDNALLSFTYLEAYQVTKDSMYAEVARETLDYILRELKSADGAFYCAEDAGEVEREGEYYVWTEKEIKDELTEPGFQIFADAYGITSEGNFENGTNILYLTESYEWAIKSDASLTAAAKRLIGLRENRKRPHKDDKVLTAWNGLTISALAKAYQVLEEESYLDCAKVAAAFILKKLFVNGELKRRYRDGDVQFDACLDDYAFLVEGLLHLYESDFNEDWLLWARKLQDLQDSKFWDKKKGGYFFTTAKEAIVRKKDLIDSALPSANSTSALNLLRLNSFFGDIELQEKADAIFRLVGDAMNSHPSAFPKMLQALNYRLNPAREIVVVSAKREEDKQFLVELYQTFMPSRALAFLEGGSVSDIPLLRNKNLIDGQTACYVCENQTCHSPTHDLEEARKLVAESKVLKVE